MATPLQRRLRRALGQFRRSSQLPIKEAVGGFQQSVAHARPLAQSSHQRASRRTTTPLCRLGLTAEACAVANVAGLVAGREVIFPDPMSEGTGSSFLADPMAI
jgi:hypothetical protein